MGAPLWIDVMIHLGGLAAGLALMTWSLRQAAGHRLDDAVRRLQDAGPWQGLVAGLAVTALLQSSSSFSLLLLAAAAAGWVRRPAGRAALVGANLGTTLTAHLTATPHLGLAILLAGGGLVAAVLGWRRATVRAAGLAALGLGAALAALDGLGRALVTLAGPAGATPGPAGPAGSPEPDWLAWVQQPWAGFAAGLVLSAGALSSSAVLAVLQRAVSAGFLRMEQALPVVYGANVGTTSDVLLAGLLLRGVALDLALFHLGMNLLNALAAVPLGPLLAAVARGLSSDPARQVAWAHTLFNVLGAVLVWPWVGDEKRRAPSGGPPPA
ncbi:Na+/phosphate symporter [Thermaerobacter subterraneus DSM 13965]|uniref:Na+/phosphate symporter n=1 Tax=Thermaerobacter subterraneus DSM 13965 TaxID=867903 RepID=K6QDF4_9FIRM|nr:Na/Pi symporter [Thermaerobacter subterraneus]EKP94711.1 Na+/phosphate symporter [Thermaerobacter subterraneus DSM 13965]